MRRGPTSTSYGVIRYIVLFSACLCAVCHGQSESTGALVGTVFDPTGATISDVLVQLRNSHTNQVQSARSGKNGSFVFALLQPGEYGIDASKANFAAFYQTNIRITVTETLYLELILQLPKAKERVEVQENASIAQTKSSALGRVVGETAVQYLPLATRNFTQIAVLSTGVIASVNNASELGIGGGGLSQIESSNDGIFVHGSRSYENNFLIDGVSVSDVQGSSAASGGIPIPNPDAIQEFKVQTGLYDASYGRYGGASISIVSQTGTDSYHGTLFEFLRNDALNANDFFRNRTNQPRPVLKQNQFGVTLGGPLIKTRLFLFDSYQGTRQVNGLAVGQARIACSATLLTPPLTDNRSPSSLGALFGGMSGANGGVAVNPDGSNINPVALALLNFKLPDGSFLIPNPQVVNAALPIASQGFSTFSRPCRFTEDQFASNADYILSPTDSVAARFFFADDNAAVTFPGSALNAIGNTGGFPSQNDSGFRVFSLSYTRAFSPTSLNQARFGFVRTRTRTVPSAPFRWSDVGVTESDLNRENELPTLNISGSVSFAPAFPRTITQNSFVVADTLSILHGKHSMRLGGSITRVQDNLHIVGIGSFVQFLSWPDFLLGLDASDNETGTFSNVFASIDNFGLLDREYRAWEGSAFLQDDYHANKSLTLNLGIRYERIGQFADNLGRNSSFDIHRADPNPPLEGTAAGYVVASNFPGNVPDGVFRAANEFANNSDGQNAVAARFGFAWQLVSGSLPVVLRGGYGLYFSRPTGQAFFQNVFSPPFSLSRISRGLANANATFQNPFAQPFPTTDSFPSFPLYSPSVIRTVVTAAPGFRPGITQQYGLNVQTALQPNWLLEIGYVGAHGAHLQRFRSANQALSASPGDPIRNVRDNRLSNISSRVPIVGFAPDGLVLAESEGESWCNGLETSLTKRLSRSLQILASYTFSKTLDTDGANINATSSGNAITRGDQNDPIARRGRASFDRTHRFVFSGTYAPPGFGKGIWRAISSRWLFSGVATIQSGNALTILLTNSSNVFGISQDRAQLASGCTGAQAVSKGSIESKISNYFNKACFSLPPIIGADGLGRGFGNSGTGLVDGPPQFNVDLGLSQAIPIKWPRERSEMQFRTEFFNALNHPQFNNPDTNLSSTTFGVVQTTAVNPRVEPEAGILILFWITMVLLYWDWRTQLLGGSNPIKRARRIPVPSTRQNCISDLGVDPRYSVVCFRSNLQECACASWGLP